MTDIFTSMLPAAFLPYEHDQSGVTDADLEIRRIPRREDRYSLESLWRTFALPAYWRGAMQTRQALGDTGRGLLLCAQIERDLIAGKGLGAAFREWREGAR